MLSLPIPVELDELSYDEIYAPSGKTYAGGSLKNWTLGQRLDVKGLT